MTSEESEVHYRKSKSSSVCSVRECNSSEILEAVVEDANNNLPATNWQHPPPQHAERIP